MDCCPFIPQVLSAFLGSFVPLCIFQERALKIVTADGHALAGGEAKGGGADWDQAQSVFPGSSHLCLSLRLTLEFFVPFPQAISLLRAVGFCFTVF